MDEDCAESGRARLGIGTDQIVPKCRAERQDRWPKTELPGFLAVRGCRGNSASLVGAWEGADQGATDGFPPLPLIRREGSPSRRKVDGRADDIALDPGCLELPQGKPAIADQRFVSRQL